MNAPRLFNLTAILASIACLIVMAAPRAVAQEEQAQPAEEPTKQAEAKPISVAILGFEAKMPGNAELGGQIGDTLTILLGDEPGLRLVERPKLNTLMEEQGLSQTGMVKPEDAIKVGNLVGAQIIVTGRLFPLGSKLYLTCKVIGSETSLVEGVLVKGDADQDIDELVTQMSGKLAKKLRESGPKLIAAEQDEDPLPALIAKLKEHKKTPRLAVLILEEHIHEDADGRRNAGQDLDPVVETAVKRALIEAGVAVFDIEPNQLADWADFSPENVNSWPRALAKVDLLIAGEAYSEVGVRVGQLVSASARAEINMIDRTDGRIIQALGLNARGVGVSPRQASAEALQAVGHDMCVRVLTGLIEQLEKDAKQNKATKKETTQPAPEGQPAGDE